MSFKDRSEADRKLAKALAAYKVQHPVILALPRGGVPVAAEVATALHAPLDLILVRKISVPIQPELAMGAVVDGGAPIIVCNEDVIKLAGIDEAEFNRSHPHMLRHACVYALANRGHDTRALQAYLGNKNIQHTVPPRRRRNGDLRTREYLTEAEVERLMKAAASNPPRPPGRDNDSGGLPTRPAGFRAGGPAVGPSGLPDRHAARP
jgi:hypothetical protein